MTIEEAVSAARRNVPVVDVDPVNGAILYARIGSIRKDFALRSDVARGKPPETYGLELLPMNGARTVTVVSPERVREATSAEIGDYRQYLYDPPELPVREELICKEVREGHYNGKPEL